jgi:hypothetical protein
MPGSPIPIPPGQLTVNARAWVGHGNLAFVSAGQLEVLSNIGGLSQITGPTGNGFDSNPAWSQDGRWLAFLHTGPAYGFAVRAPTLWLAETGTAVATEVSVNGIGMFAWSPTADVLAYSVVPPGNSLEPVPEDIWIDQPGSPPTAIRVGSGDGVGTVAWSPNGTGLAFDDIVAAQPGSAHSPATPPASHIGVVSVSGGQVTIEYQATEAGLELAGWWPDGAGLLFWEDSGYSASLQADGLMLYSLGSGDQQPVGLVTSLVVPTWWTPGPDNTVAVVAGGGREIWEPGRDVDLCALPAATCRPVSIPAASVGLASSWSAAGTLFFSVASASPPFGPAAGMDYSAANMAEWDGTNTLWALPPGGQPSRVGAAPVGTVLAAPAAEGTAEVEVAHNGLWLVDTTGDAAVQIAGPLYSVANPAGYYGEVNWAGTFAWSEARGPRQGSAQKFDISISGPEAQLP